MGREGRGREGKGGECDGPVVEDEPLLHRGAQVLYALQLSLLRPHLHSLHLHTQSRQVRELITKLIEASSPLNNHHNRRQEPETQNRNANRVQ